MINFIDNFLNKITMYRLMLYYLIFLLAAAVLLSLFGRLPFSPISLVLTSSFIVAVSWLANTIFAKAFKAPTNVESVYITALILALIITPLRSSNDLSILVWAPILAMASKYILAINKKHLFNPAAFSVALTAAALNQSASWWVGTASMLPFVLLGGLLIVRKIRRTNMVLSFLGAALATILIFSFFKGSPLPAAGQRALLESPLLFFAFVMLTEPLTTPPTSRLQSLYGALVGFLFAPQIHFGSGYSTPELALIVGNMFSYLVSPKEKLILKLKERVQTARDSYDFVFNTDRKLAFLPGQYLEWTLGHDNPDERGNRRYFTIASSPTEREIRMGVKFYEKPSSFKKSLWSEPSGREIVASQLAGDFVLPKDPREKCVFIAGGIGITPFRSMIKYLLDTGQSRPIILLYASKSPAEIAYRDVFDEAERRLGIKTIYVVSEDVSSDDRRIRKGHIDLQLIQEEVPDFKERLFYLSGPRSMVISFEETLKIMGLKKKQIKTDFFPGFA